MLSNKLQEEILLTIGQDLKHFDTFSKNQAIDEDLFSDKNKKKLRGLRRARELGYDKLTEEFINQYELDLYLDKKTNNDVLDTILKVKQENSTSNKQKASADLTKYAERIKNAKPGEETEIINEMKNKVLGIQSTEQIEGTKNLAEIIQSDWVYDENKKPIPSYIDEMDRTILNGGFSRSGVHIISAFPGNGKTTSAIQITTNQAMRGYKVLFISLEQSRKKIANNVLSIIAEEKDKDKTYWNSEKIAKEKMDERKNEALKNIDKRIKENYKIDDTRWNTQEEFINFVSNACLIEKYDVVVIDNFQNAPKPKDFMQVEMAYSGLADKIDNIAKLSNTVVLALSQLTLSNGQKKTKYSARLNENAINNIEMELVKEEEGEELDFKTIRMTSLKGRDGGMNEKIILHFDGAKGVIGEIKLPDITGMSIEDSVRLTGFPF